MLSSSLPENPIHFAPPPTHLDLLQIPLSWERFFMKHYWHWHGRGIKGQRQQL